MPEGLVICLHVTKPCSASLCLLQRRLDEYREWDSVDIESLSFLSRGQPILVLSTRPMKDTASDSLVLFWPKTKLACFSIVPPHQAVELVDGHERHFLTCLSCQLFPSAPVRRQTCSSLQSSSFNAFCIRISCIPRVLWDKQCRMAPSHTGVRITHRPKRERDPVRCPRRHCRHTSLLNRLKCSRTPGDILRW